MTIEKQLQILRIYTGALTIGMFVILAAGFQTTKRQKIKELDVERINIVEPDGKLRMTISNKERIPDPVLNGKTYTGARNGSKTAGMIFFNDEGDECGGLAFSGKANQQGQGQAGGQLLFDQFHQDQTVGIMYSQSGDRRSAGLHVWDRPLTPASEYVDKLQAIKKMPEGPEKQAATDQIKQAVARGELGMHRLFVGNDSDGATGMTIADRLGKKRVALVVDQKNAAHLQFLDESGKVVYTVPPEAPFK
jgi:hypothetical protein